MIRTQIQLEPSTYEEMKKMASKLGCSLAELARRSIEETLMKSRLEGKWGRSLQVAGRYKSGLGDLSIKHDQYFGDEW
jgi:hypothetical protein